MQRLTHPPVVFDVFVDRRKKQQMKRQFEGERPVWTVKLNKAGREREGNERAAAAAAAAVVVAVAVVVVTSATQHV